MLNLTWGDNLSQTSNPSKRPLMFQNQKRKKRTKTSNTIISEIREVNCMSIIKTSKAYLSKEEN